MPVLAGVRRHPLLSRIALRLFAAVLAFLPLAGLPESAAAQETEEILSYDVSIDLRPGGQLAISERITVRALGQEIRRGIYRDIPSSFPRWSGLGRIEAPFAVTEVLRDGQPEPFTVLSIGGEMGRGGIRIRAGRSDVFLDPGVYEYTFEYETDRWVRFGDSEDQLFWNVTGNGWSFSNLSATARVHIEELEVEPLMEAWTGPDGSTESDAEFAWDGAERAASFRTTRGLGPFEGFTIRLTFPSGYVTPPSEEQQAEWFALDWGGYIEAGYLVLLVIGIYLVMWRRVGVDPAAGPTLPRAEPPKGFSPAALSYIQERGYRTSQFAAALVSMALKGAIRIEREEDSWTLRNLNADAELAPEERKVFDRLLGPSPRFDLEQSRHAKLRGAIKELKKTLARDLEREYFVNNRRWFLAGVAMSVLGLLALAWRWRFSIEPPAWFLCIWLTGWTAGVATMVTRVFKMLRAGRKEPAAMAGALGLALFSLPFVGAEIFVLGMLVTMVPSHLVLAALLVGGTNVAFYHLLERPTLRGQGVLDQLEGFKAYLVGTQERRRSRTGSIEHFEQYLPHAIALGIEERWADGFGSALTPTGQPSTTPVPHWYSDSTSSFADSGFNASSFASSLGSSLSSTISSASSPPPSSGGGGGGGGGFSGGGSSGGGGGGGGGGGW